VDSGGQTHLMAQHNLMTDAAWFFPALSAMFGPNVSLSYVGAETLDGISVQHIRFWQSFSGEPPGVAALLQQLSTTDVYLDASSLLPVVVRFAVHPDDDANVSIPLEIRYSAYEKVAGVTVPFRVQKWINNGLGLELVVGTAAVNPSLASADFQISR
jgi:hypothetical protein